MSDESMLEDMIQTLFAEEESAPQQGLAHPYYPRSMAIPNFVPPVWQRTEILSVFFSAVLVVVVSSFSTIRKVTPSTGYRLTYLWFVLTALIHMMVEGWFVTFNQTIAERTDFMSDMWKEYAHADSRYLVSELTVLWIEAVTSYIWGPICLWIAARLYRAAAGYPSGNPVGKGYEALTHCLILLISLGQLYGCVLYFGTSFSAGVPDCDLNSPLAFYFYFIGMNIVWIIVPGIQIVRSIQCVLELVEPTQASQVRKADTVKHSSTSPSPSTEWSASSAFHADGSPVTPRMRTAAKAAAQRISETVQPIRNSPRRKKSA